MNKIDDFRLKHPKIKIELIDMSTNQLLDSTPIDNVYNNISITPVCSLKTCFIKSTKSKSNPKTLEDLEKENIISYLWW